jgi:hypothetical protein
MSNFESLALVTEGLNGSAPCRFIASTADSYSQLLAAGYLNDISRKVKQNDRFDVCYNDASTFPLNVGESALFASFSVQYDPVLGNWNLVPAASNVVGLGAYGVHSAKYAYAGGSASFVVSDPAINPNSVVVGRFQSSANAVGLLTVLPGNGQISVVASADPGASVFSYIVINPNVALQSAGVLAASYANAGGSATIVILNAAITTSMVVNVNFASQANASEVEKVTVAAGSITILCTADPGVSVVDYVAVLPSSALTTLGYYGANYTNAGGSATVTITDANILAASVIVANVASSANAVFVEKVTPSAGSLVILLSGDPGASVISYQGTNASFSTQPSVYLQAANNLSDVASASASLANLGGLPLAGGQMTGQLLMDRGTATSTAGAATVNHQAGVITTEALTTASGSAYAFTLTNSRILTTSIVLCSLLGGTNTKHGLSFTSVISAGSAAISVLNNDISAAALNGTLIFGFVVI